MSISEQWEDLKLGLRESISLNHDLRLNFGKNPRIKETLMAEGELISKAFKKIDTRIMEIMQSRSSKPSMEVFLKDIIQEGDEEIIAALTIIDDILKSNGELDVKRGVI